MEKTMNVSDKHGGIQYVRSRKHFPFFVPQIGTQIDKMLIKKAILV